MSRKKRLTEEDIVELYDLVTTQLGEDRAAVNDLYEELRAYIKDHPSRYVELGEVLAKLTDLKMKQTGQVLDVFKTIEKAVPKDEFGALSEADVDFINKEINKEKK
jgi:hypothetical protein